MTKDKRPLTEKEIKTKLKQFPGWTYKDNKINKKFEFESFIDALTFINKLAFFSETIDHHPDIHIFYRKIIFELQRFDIGGKVTEKDFRVARKIEDLFKEYKFGKK